MCFIFALDTAATQYRGTTDADEQTSRDTDESSQGCLHMHKRSALAHLSGSMSCELTCRDQPNRIAAATRPTLAPGRTR
jgi:hypothetical protein